MFLVVRLLSYHSNENIFYRSILILVLNLPLRSILMETMSDQDNSPFNVGVQASRQIKSDNRDFHCLLPQMNRINQKGLILWIFKVKELNLLEI